ncbi:hypothetical protein [Streptomyces mangrovisoli]|uniref:hypothetical protein n=1 Tax=Streptomyces mangrovisoli TaxID=1428628 RepID=UPI001160D259|nr:hypothetical protein [Streptomyces mangrovisoli]
MTRVGPSRHSLTKTVAVTGAEAGAVLGGARLPLPPGSLGAPEIVPDAPGPGLLTVRCPDAWLGTSAARDETYGYLADVLAALADSARSLRATLHAPGVQLDANGPRPALADDPHAMCTVDDAEQEVLVNLLRRHSPTLIALTGRVRVGGPADRAGSRRLLESREHLATRYLAAPGARYLEHHRGELRRREGISDLLRMDVAPVVGRPGVAAEVVIRCVDAQVSLADLRAQALLLDALALKARRMAARGLRETDVAQRVIDTDRTRAVAEGLRAQFVKPGGRDVGADGGGSGGVSARLAGRRLLRELVPELTLLEASALELLPLLAPLELPDLGLRPLRTQDLLGRAAAGRPGELRDCAEAQLCDPSPGGALREALRETSPGRLELLLANWDAFLAGGVVPTDLPAADSRPRRGDHNNRGGRGGQGDRSGQRAQNRKGGGAPGGRNGNGGENRGSSNGGGSNRGNGSPLNRGNSNSNSTGRNDNRGDNGSGVSNSRSDKGRSDNGRSDDGRNGNRGGSGGTRGGGSADGQQQRRRPGRPADRTDRRDS